MTKILKRCKTCGGTKIIRGMGMIEKKCHNCLGVGSIEETHDDPIVEEVKSVTLELKKDDVVAETTLELKKPVIDLRKKKRMSE